MDMEKTEPKLVLSEIITHTKPYRNIQYFSQKPGIYGITFLGGETTLKCGDSSIKPKTLIYIGKTESSQIKRDVKNHFGTGKTGHSTLRRSIGALLLDDLELKPQPRSITEATERKYTNYKFDDDGEARLTEWMKSNLGIGFCEFDKQEVRGLEKRLIQFSTPLLNIHGNISSPFHTELCLARAKCKELARNKDALAG